MTRRPAYNAEGTPHIYATGPEAAELARIVRDETETYTGQSKNTDHAKHPVFNPDAKPSELGAQITSGDSEGFTRGYAARREQLDVARKTGGDIAGAQRALRRQANVAANRPALD